MTEESRPAKARPVLNTIAAQLFVSDIGTSCEFFTAKLGFEVDFVYGKPPFYAQVSRDAARLALRQIHESVFVGDVIEREHLISAAITVATVQEIEQLFANCQSAGVSFHQPLQEEPWGARAFIVRDPDGNLILFAGPAR